MMHFWREMELCTLASSPFFIFTVWRVVPPPPRTYYMDGTLNSAFTSHPPIYHATPRRRLLDRRSTDRPKNYFLLPTRNRLHGVYPYRSLIWWLLTCDVSDIITMIVYIMVGTGLDGTTTDHRYHYYLLLLPTPMLCCGRCT